MLAGMCGALHRGFEMRGPAAMHRRIVLHSADDDVRGRTVESGPLVFCCLLDGRGELHEPREVHLRILRLVGLLWEPELVALHASLRWHMSFRGLAPFSSVLHVPIVLLRGAGSHSRPLKRPTPDSPTRTSLAPLLTWLREEALAGRVCTRTQVSRQARSGD